MLVQPKRLALLVYLVLAAPRGFERRDHLLALFWPESDQSRARRALRQALHFLRHALGPGVVVGRGDDEVGLAAGALWCDGSAFEEAVSEGRWADALDLYHGDLLEGFFVSGTSPEFERWLEDTRGVLKGHARRAASSCAADDESGGNIEGAVRWARRAVALAPEDEGAVRRLVTLLVRLGDRGGALETYDLFARRVSEEFGTEPSAAMRSLVAPLRAVGRTRPHAESTRGSHDGDASGRTADRAVGGAAGSSVASVRSRVSALRLTRARLATLVGIGVVAVTGAVLFRAAPRASPDVLLAVGAIDDAVARDTAGITRILPPLIATDLARVPGLKILSHTQLAEVLAQVSAGKAGAGSVLDAARRAGASELLEGVMYHRGRDTLQLDLRRIDLRTGVVHGVYSVNAADPFTLAEHVTQSVARGFGLTMPTPRLAAATPPSLVARRLYDEGLRSYYSGDARSALRLFHAALVEDSSAAMAAYFAAFCERELGNAAAAGAELARAVRLADRASDRERLIIRVAWADRTNTAARLALGETLAVRYPAEPDGEMALAAALVSSGNFLAAVPRFQRAMMMSSSSQRSDDIRCGACDAMQGIISAYLYADSLAEAERESRAWIGVRPRSPAAWVALAMVLAREDRYAEAFSAQRRAAQLDPRTVDDAIRLAELDIRSGNFARADRLLSDRARDGAPAARAEALWWLTISFRTQGRLREALVTAERHREIVGATDLQSGGAIPEAQVLFEMGRFREAVALNDSLAGAIAADSSGGSSLWARNLSWRLTQVGTSLAAEGDTAGVVQVAHRVEDIGRRSTYGRDPLLYHHLRGLLLTARGQWDEAIGEYRRSLFSTTEGYTRTNLELGRVLLRRHRPREAVAILAPALRGPVEAANLFVTRTELHELLGQAFEAAGQGDSAGVHYRRVEQDWGAGDQAFRARARRAHRSRLALDR